MIERYVLSGNVALGEGILDGEIHAFVDRVGGRGVLITGATGGAGADPRIEAPRVSVRHVRTVPALVETADSAAFIGAEWVVAIGGAATIDVAKLLRVRTPSGDNPFRRCQHHRDVDAALEAMPRFL